MTWPSKFGGICASGAGYPEVARWSSGKYSLRCRRTCSPMIQMRRNHKMLPGEQGLMATIHRLKDVKQARHNRPLWPNYGRTKKLKAGIHQDLLERLLSGKTHFRSRPIPDPHGCLPDRQAFAICGQPSSPSSHHRVLLLHSNLDGHY